MHCVLEQTSPSVRSINTNMAGWTCTKMRLKIHLVPWFPGFLESGTVCWRIQSDLDGAFSHCFFHDYLYYLGGIDPIFTISISFNRLVECIFFGHLESINLNYHGNAGLDQRLWIVVTLGICFVISCSIFGIHGFHKLHVWICFTHKCCSVLFV